MIRSYNLIGLLLLAASVIEWYCTGSSTLAFGLLIFGKKLLIFSVILFRELWGLILQSIEILKDII